MTASIIPFSSYLTPTQKDVIFTRMSVTQTAQAMQERREKLEKYLSFFKILEEVERELTLAEDRMRGFALDLGSQTP